MSSNPYPTIDPNGELREMLVEAVQITAENSKQITNLLCGINENRQMIKKIAHTLMHQSAKTDEQLKQTDKQIKDLIQTVKESNSR